MKRTKIPDSHLTACSFWCAFDGGEGSISLTEWPELIDLLPHFGFKRVAERSTEFFSDCRDFKGVRVPIFRQTETGEFFMFGPELFRPLTEEEVSRLNFETQSAGSVA